MENPVGGSVVKFEMGKSARPKGPVKWRNGEAFRAGEAAFRTWRFTTFAFRAISRESGCNSPFGRALLRLLFYHLSVIGAASCSLAYHTPPKPGSDIVGSRRFLHRDEHSGSDDPIYHFTI